MRKYMAFVMLLASFAAGAQEQPVATPKLLRAQDLPVEVEPEALQRQYNALQTMRLARLKYSLHGPVQNIDGDTSVLLPSTLSNLKKGDSAPEVLQLFGDILLAKGSESLMVTRHDSSIPSQRTLRLSQSIRGIPVINGGIAIEYDATTRLVTGLTAIFVPDRDLPSAPKLSATEAEQIVPEVLALAEDKSATEVEVIEGTYLGYYVVPAEPGPPRLVWAVRAQVRKGVQEFFFVNAVTGLIVDRQPESAGLTRIVYNANFNSPTIPNGLTQQMLLDPSEIAADPYASKAYGDVATADDKLRQRLFFLPGTRFPSTTKQVVRYVFDENEDDANARHERHGSDDFIMYSGPTSITNSATSPRDITFHEYGHGIAKRTFSTTGDTFDNQIGALHESFADIMATIVDVAIRGTPAAATWRIAEGFLDTNPSYIRSLANPYWDSWGPNSVPAPGADWFPLREMGADRQWQNSALISHAYYLSIYGGMNANAAASYIPEISVPALVPLNPASSEGVARQIFVTAFDDDSMHLAPGFYDLRAAAESKAFTLFGSAARTSIRKAFDAVGIGYQCSSEPGTVFPAIEDLQCNGRFSVNWPDIPGGDRYIVMVAPVVYGWSFGLIATDGMEATHCMVGVQQYSMLRMRACNNCGCGPWSQTQYLPYSPGPCP